MDKKTKLILGLLGVLTLALIISSLVFKGKEEPVQYSATSDIAQKILEGVLSISVPATVALPNVTVSISAQTATSSFATGGSQAIIATDQRGTGAGWSVTMTATSFLCQETTPGTCAVNPSISTDNYHLITFNSNATTTEVTARNATTTITAGSITAVSGNLTGVSAGSAEVLTNTITPNDDISDPKSLMTATTYRGLGSFSQDSEIQLDIPANPFAAPTYGYKSVFTITVS